MILKLIILVSMGQIFLYLVLEKLDLKYGKSILFLLILIGHFFIFPQFFYPQPDSNQFNCGLPILGITLAFWVIGGSTTILVHTIYYLIRKLLKSKYNEPQSIDNMSG
jgi:hypothetical protein